MQFLMNFFSSKKATPKKKKNQKKKELQYLGLDPSRTQQLFVGNHMGSSQQKILKQPLSLQPNFHLSDEAVHLKINLLELNDTLLSEESLKIDFGILVGVINNYKNHKEFIGDSFSVHIGIFSEVNSLKALRNYCLDTLIIFWNNLSCQFTLNQIIEVHQRLVIVLEDWPSVNNFLTDYQTALIEKLGQSLLSQCSDKLIFNLIQFKDKFILEFQDEKKFTKKFISRIKSKMPSLSALANLEQIISMMSLNEYKKCCRIEELSPQIRNKIEQYGSEIERINEENLKKEELAKLDLLLAAEKEEEIELIPEPVRKNSSMEADIEAEYFGKAKNLRESQKETRESGASLLVDAEELYYFIEQHEENSNEDYSYINNQQSKVSDRPSNTPPRIPRSKSWNSLSKDEPEELDDEFFNKD